MLLKEAWTIYGLVILTKASSFFTNHEPFMYLGGQEWASWISWRKVNGLYHVRVSKMTTASLSQDSNDYVLKKAATDHGSHQLGYLVSFSSSRIYTVPSWANTLCLQHSHKMWNYHLSICFWQTHSGCTLSLITSFKMNVSWRWVHCWLACHLVMKLYC